MKAADDPETVEMRRLYNSGWGLREIAEQFGMTYQGVHYRLTKGAALPTGTEMRSRGGSRTRQIDPEQLRALYVERKLPVYVVAIKLKTTSPVIVRELTRLRIHIRPRGSYSTKHPGIGKLAVGQPMEVEEMSRRKVHPRLYDMAKRQGVQISIKKVSERRYRLTRVG